MDTNGLRAVLDVLRDAGVRRASFAAGGLADVEFYEAPEPVTPFVAKDGKPVDLDAGAGPLTRDPDAELESANFPKPERDG